MTRSMISPADKNSRALLLICSMLTYLLLGAAVFGRLESAADAELREQINEIKRRLDEKYHFKQEDLDLFQILAIKSVPHKGGLQWSFPGSFYFATVVITTVGYGHSAPGTTAGKLFCIFYSMLGIPLGLVMFQSIGERVNTAISFLLTKVRCRLLQLGMRSLPEVSVSHLLAVSFSLGFSLIVSTIGLGDLVAVQTSDALQKKPLYLLFTLLFILFGLALFSACVNLLVLRFMATNADEVSAAAKLAPQPSVVFEHFARSSSVNLFKLGRPRESKISNAHKLSTALASAAAPLLIQATSGTKKVEPEPSCCLAACTNCTAKGSLLSNTFFNTNKNLLANSKRFGLKEYVPKNKKP